MTKQSEMLNHSDRNFYSCHFFFSMLKLKCVVQNYAWGCYPPEGEVARLFGLNAGDEAVNGLLPYAELWMGTHSSGPSEVAKTGVSLQRWIENRPDALGDAVRSKFGIQLPFLFKVLSIRTALSIQSHPDKALAQRLHSERPQVYRDGNHKPEIAIALTEFDALCSFAPFGDIVEAFDSYPEMQRCIDEETLDKVRMASLNSQRQVLREAFSELMTCSTDTISIAVGDLIRRLERIPIEKRSFRDRLLLRLNNDHPKDVGIFASLFLNHIKLSPGSAVYLPANEPHAYLHGDVVECMATSDNVIRAGLTSKLRDTDTLCRSLSYTMGKPALLNGKEEGDAVVYRPPFEEFEVHKIELLSRQRHRLNKNQGPSLLLVQKGSGTMKGSEEFRCTAGEVVFVSNEVSVEIEATGADGLVLWRATINRSIFESVTV